MNDEQYTSYSVHGSQLRYAKAMLDANGIPVSAINRQGDIYVIVIPAADAGFNHATAAAPRRARPWWMLSRRTVVTLAMVAVAGVGVYLLFSGVRINGVELPTVSLPVAETAASVNNAVDSARNAAMTFLWAVGSLLLLGALWAFRGPLSAIAHGIGGAVGTLKGMVKRG